MRGVLERGGCRLFVLSARVEGRCGRGLARLPFAGLHSAPSMCSAVKGLAAAHERRGYLRLQHHIRRRVGHHVGRECRAPIVSVRAIFVRVLNVEDDADGRCEGWSDACAQVRHSEAFGTIDAWA